MDGLRLLEAEYVNDPVALKILIPHSQAVANKALSIAQKMLGTGIDTSFVYQAALVHDLGIRFTHAPEIGCYGKLPYICHGFMGHDRLLSLGFPRHALVAERHTGTGITLPDVVNNKLPLPHRQFIPLSVEEILIAYCDKFFSKTGDPMKEKTVDRIVRGLEKYGPEKAHQFLSWHDMFNQWV